MKTTLARLVKCKWMSRRMNLLHFVCSEVRVSIKLFNLFNRPVRKESCSNLSSVAFFGVADCCVFWQLCCMDRIMKTLQILLSRYCCSSVNCSLARTFACSVCGMCFHRVMLTAKTKPRTYMYGVFFLEWQILLGHMPNHGCLQWNPWHFTRHRSDTPASLFNVCQCFRSALQHFQHQLTSKHPVYYSTMRLGRGLKDRCTKSDPERDILQGMLDELKNKWTIIRSIAAQRSVELLQKSWKLPQQIGEFGKLLFTVESRSNTTRPKVSEDENKMFEMDQDQRSHFECS